MKPQKKLKGIIIDIFKHKRTGKIVSEIMGYNYTDGSFTHSIYDASKWELLNSENKKLDLKKSSLSEHDTIKEVLEIVEEMIKEQKTEYRRCKDLRTTRMKNSDRRNWGMIDAENKIISYKEVKYKIKEIK